MALAARDMTSSVLSAARFGLVSYFCCFASSASAAQPTMQAGARINDFLYAQPRLPPAGTRRRLSFSSRDALTGQASRSRPRLASSADCRVEPRDSSLVRQPGPRGFHTYFVTHLPSSSLHPDSHGSVGPGHKLPRDASTPHIPGPGSSPAVAPFNMPGPDLTVVRIPLRRAKHHFGSFTSRGSRPYNEDADQAGIVELPAFAKRAPLSVKQKLGEPTAAESATGDPQIFYFAIFDGHGGAQCAQFLRDELHGYIEEAVAQFQLPSSLRKKDDSVPAPLRTAAGRARGSADVEAEGRLSQAAGSRHQPGQAGSAAGADPTPDKIRNGTKALQLQRDLVQAYRNTIGGYFKRFSPEHFGLKQGDEASASTVESCLTYAFLRADLDFVSAQARKADPDKSDIPLNHDEILGAPHATPSGHGIGGATRFKGGSTASVALISTPTPTPFWHPGAQSTLVVAHVGDSRILLCDTATGRAQPLTSDHHPSSPTESRRLRRYAPAGSMVTGDSFGESRIAGFANSRAFGDIQSKRLGVSAEPELTRVDMGPAQYSFLVLASDGVSASLSDQEIVDVVKEARTPDEGARRLVDFATEIVRHPDNATCQVVRLGGWERRSEGGLGSLGTKEVRDAHRAEALDPRRAR